MPAGSYIRVSNTSPVTPMVQLLSFKNYLEPIQSLDIRHMVSLCTERNLQPARRTHSRTLQNLFSSIGPPARPRMIHHSQDVPSSGMVGSPISSPQP